MLLAAVAVGRTQGILHLPRSVIDRMHQVVRKEKRERAKHARTVDRAEQAFQVAQSEGTVGLGEGLEHQQAVGRGLDVALGEQRLEVVVHCVGKGKNDAALTANHGKTGMIAMPAHQILGKVMHKKRYTYVSKRGFLHESLHTRD